MKTIYISGKITGLPAHEVEHKFAFAELRFPSVSFKVINPATLCADIEEGSDWREYMRRCIKALADADMIYVLPCYKDSRGAQMEIFIAMTLGIEIIYAQL
jgi:hypothetical protein